MLKFNVTSGNPISRDLCPKMIRENADWDAKKHLHVKASPTSKTEEQAVSQVSRLLGRAPLAGERWWWPVMYSLKLIFLVKSLLTP